MISSGGAVTGPVGAVGRDRHEAEAREIGPRELREALGAEQREAERRCGRDRAEQQPRRAVLEAQHDVGGVVRRRRGRSARWCTSTSRTRPANSIMWSIECTPTAVIAPPGASSGWARQLSAGMNWPVEVVCVATIDITWPSWPVGEALADFHHRGMEAAVEADRQHDAGFLRRGDGLLGARPVERQRLLDMDVLAGRDRGHHLLGVLAVRRRQHHGVDARGCEHVLEAVAQRDASLAAERPRRSRACGCGPR